jgi:hypothetical protein
MKVHTLLMLVSWQLWWNIFYNKGFFMLSLGLGKIFLQLYIFLLDFKVNLSKPLEEYKGINPPSRSIFVVIEKATLQRLLQGVKGITPL